MANAKTNAKKATTVSEQTVRTVTGRGWAEWTRTLIKAGGRGWSHKEIVGWLAANTELSSWWRQSVAVEFEKATGKRVLGQTADAGFQVGVRTTVRAAVSAVWEALVSPAGKSLWLGSKTAELSAKAGYRGAGRVSGEVRVVKPRDRVRFTRAAPGGAASTVQIALEAVGAAKTTITFHHDKLQSSEEREAMRGHWKGVAERLGRLIDSPAKVAKSPAKKSPSKARPKAAGARPGARPARSRKP
jgi:uncharacterized protein YndB with AHSA1/START domain